MSIFDIGIGAFWGVLGDCGFVWLCFEGFGMVGLFGTVFGFDGVDN